MEKGKLAKTSELKLSTSRGQCLVELLLQSAEQSSTIRPAVSFVWIRKAQNKPCTEPQDASLKACSGFSHNLNRSNEQSGSAALTHRVDEDKGGEVSVCHSVPLEPDGDHVTVTGLQAEGPGHVNDPGRRDEEPSGQMWSREPAVLLHGSLLCL